MITHLRSQKLLISTVKLVCALILRGVTKEVCYAENENRFFATVSFSKAPLENITGTVKDTKGEALPGVNVLIKGTKTGTVTYIKGRFRLNLPTGNETLIGWTTCATQPVPRQPPKQNQKRVFCRMRDVSTTTTPINTCLKPLFGTMPRPTLRLNIAWGLFPSFSLG